MAPRAGAADPLHRLALTYVPDAICSRQPQKAVLGKFLHKAVVHNEGSAMYISGLPGTGKTALVQNLLGVHTAGKPDSVASQWQVLWVNCMQIDGSRGVFEDLGRQLPVLRRLATTKEETDPLALERKLKERFYGAPRGRNLWVVVCDEVEALLGKAPTGSKAVRRAASRAAFDALMAWALDGASKLCVIAISNDMNLADTFLVGHQKQVKRLHFPSYKPKDLLEIAHHRLGPAWEQQIQPRALEFLAAKVAGETGDARRMLEHCRQALEAARATAPAEPEARQSRKRSSPDNAATGSSPKRLRQAAAATNFVTPPRAPSFTLDADESVDSPPSLRADTPPDVRHAKVDKAVGMVQAASLFANTNRLQDLPEKQKYLLVAGVLLDAGGNKAPTVGNWLDFYKVLCKQKHLIAVTDSEVHDMLTGLAHLRLIELGKAGPRTPQRLQNVFIRVRRDDIEHAFGKEGIVMDLLAAKPPRTPA